MKSRARALVIAAIPTFLVGICGFWLLWRGPLLSSGIDKALGKLRQQGIATQVTDLEWTSLGTAHIAQISGVVGRDTLLSVRDISLNMRPSFSLSGRDWVNAVNFGELHANYKGWQIKGAGQFCPSTLALQLEGEFEKSEVFGGHQGTKAPSWMCQTWCLGALVAKSQPSNLPSKIMPRGNVSGHFKLQLGAQTRVAGKRHFDAGLHITQLAMQHPALGDEIKTIRELDAWARVEVGKNDFALRPGSCLRIGDLRLCGSAEWNALENAFALRVAVPTQPAAGLLAVADALAPSYLQGLRIAGEAQGYLRLAGDLDSLQTLQLEGDLQGNGIALQDGGLLRLDTLRNRARQEGMVALDDMPQYLVQAVILSEDANFLTHHGFDKEIIRLAIIENWEAGKFVRGAGTIPMQLMRNIYLHLGKQADRKLAEIALTWIAEETNLIDKSTQLELYINLIEWGPEIYGIRQAAQYYFHKTPSKLTVDESIFLAAIIPNPRYYAHLLEADGSLTPYAQEYYDSMRWMLYEGDFIGEEWLEAEYPVFSVRV